jgi:glutaminase
LEELGLHCESKEIQNCVKKMERNGRIELLEFTRVLTGGPSLVKKAIMGDLAIPNFQEFCEDMKLIYHETAQNKEGTLPEYIPELSKVDPELFGVSFCTVDGQTFAYGDSDVDFPLQATILPLAYCLACEQSGYDNIHKFIGREPSGGKYNDFKLNSENKPHNPLINTGGIIIGSLLEPKENPSVRFGNVFDIISQLSGEGRISFMQRVYLSEKSHGERNHALSYFMRGSGVKGLEGNKITEVLDFYFQMCAIACNTRDLGIIAATLANGGLCPLTNKRVLSSETVKNCLSLLYSCGMYDYSGQWAFQVGLPSKSGISGCIMVIIPNVMGLAIYSPRVDKRGNSARGIEFCRKLTNKFNLSIFDELISGVSTKTDPTLNTTVNSEAMVE